MNTLLFLKLLLPSYKWTEECWVIQVAVIALELSNPSDRAAVVVLIAVVGSKAVVLLSSLIVRLLLWNQFILKNIIFVFQNTELDFIMLFQICNFLFKDLQLGITIHASIIMIMRRFTLENILILSFKTIEVSPHKLV